MDINNKALNIIIEQNNTSSITCDYHNTRKYGYVNTSYFNFRKSIVSVDIDSKYYNLSSGYRKQFSNIYKLAFGNKETLKFNIFDEIEKDTAFNDAFEIANILVKNSDILKNDYSFNLYDNVRDFLLMLILHVKCSDYSEKNLYGCFNMLLIYVSENENNNQRDLNDFFDNIISSPHCSFEIHEYISNNSKRFKNMNKTAIEMIYHKVLSLLNIFQNYNLRMISSKSDFCIKDFIMNKPKSLYITLPSSDIEINNSYIKMIIIFFINKIKKYFDQKTFNNNSFLLLIDDFQNIVSESNYMYFNKKIILPNKKFNCQNKFNIPVISTRENLLKECKKSIKPDLKKRQWYHIPDEVYMQNEETAFEPLFVSKIPNDDELNAIQDRIELFDDDNNKNDNTDYKNIREDINDRKIQSLFNRSDYSSSDNKDADYERNRNNIEIILHKKIIHKNMYYSKKNEQEINELFYTFSRDVLNKIMNNLEQKKKRQGIICILAGSAGTGKTETALQIAKKCKRNIVKYDATQISTSFIGISACKVKEIFESYYKVVKHSINCPILFLNEADSIFSRRIDLSYSINQVASVDENRTQTILLEALENFKGIMLATTNNIINFDPAFERRFLYKIVFDKPDQKARMMILNDKIPELNEEERQFIVNNYNLTGAQIENISQKLEIKKVIKDKVSFDEIKNFCKGETDNCFTQIEKHIGFK